MASVNGVQRAMSELVTSMSGGRRKLLFANFRGESYYLLFAVPAILLLVFFFFLPLWEVLQQSFGGSGGFTLDNYDKALNNDFYRMLWRNTLEYSVSTTLISLILGYPVAYYLASSSGRRRALVLVAVIIPFLTHFVAQTSIWRIVLGRRGWINETLVDTGIIAEPLEILFTRFAVMVGVVQTYLPFMILCIYAGMLGIPRGLTMVAAGLGATPFRNFRRVYLPLSMPGVWAGVLLVFVLSVGSFAAQDILGGIQNRGIASYLRGGGGLNAALAMLLLVAILALFFIFVRFIGFGPIYRAGEAFMRSAPVAVGEARGRRVVLGSVVALVGLYLLLPTFIVVILSFNDSSFVLFPPRGFTLRWYGTYFNGDDPQADWMGSTIRSLEIAVLVVILALVLGGLVSYGLVRGRYPGKPIINSLMLVPLVIPTVVIAEAIFRLYFFNEYMRSFMGTIPGFVFPHTVLALPYVVIILTATFRNADEVHEQAAMSLGANRFTTLRRIILPQILPGLAMAGFLAFLVSFNEAVIALFLKTRLFQTLPMNIWGGRVAEYGPMMGAASTIVMLIAVILLVGVIYLRRRTVRRTG
ncbi:MAG: ABC transporter permease subunit [Chloroflexi bacterium]|nr:ABC transporter permease subunit [Chloroflexota bacterium]